MVKSLYSTFFTVVRGPRGPFFFLAISNLFDDMLSVQSVVTFNESLRFFFHMDPFSSLPLGGIKDDNDDGIVRKLVSLAG